MPPEEPRPAVRGGEPVRLVFQALADLESLKRSLADLLKRFDGLEHRVSALEAPRA